MKSAFIDTNVFISAYMFAGNERKIISKKPKDIRFFISQQVIDEITDVLKHKFNLDDRDIQEYILKIETEFKFSAPDYNIKLTVRDQKDTDILKSAIHAKCDYLITGDKDLQTLREINNLKIINTAEFIRIMKL